MPSYFPPQPWHHVSFFWNALHCTAHLDNPIHPSDLSPLPWEKSSYLAVLHPYPFHSPVFWGLFFIVLFSFILCWVLYTWLCSCTVKNSTLAKQRSGLSPLATGSNLEDHGVSYLPLVFLFACRSWVTLDSLTMWFRVGALGYLASIPPLEGLETEVNHMGHQPCLCDGAPIKILDSKAQMNLPGWQYSVHIITHQSWKSYAVHDSRGRGQLKLHVWKFPGLCPRYLFSWLIFICIF